MFIADGNQLGLCYCTIEWNRAPMLLSVMQVYASCFLVLVEISPKLFYIKAVSKLLSVSSPKPGL